MVLIIWGNLQVFVDKLYLFGNGGFGGFDNILVSAFGKFLK
jgi:hypothetical protein